MRRICSKFILDILGWKVNIRLPDVNKCVVIGYPHTSNWDFVLGLLMMWSINISPNWIGKHTLFRGPLNWLFRSLGGIPVNRSAPQNIVQQIIEQFNKRKNLVLGIAPEGTRAKTDYWKSGFYNIAMGANVPIALGYLDYPHKKIGIGPSFIPKGNIYKDIEFIRKFYADKVGKYAEKMGQIRFSKNVMHFLEKEDSNLR